MLCNDRVVETETDVVKIVEKDEGAKKTADQRTEIQATAQRTTVKDVRGLTDHHMVDQRTRNPATAQRTSKDVGGADQTSHDVVNQTTTTKHQVKIHPTRKDTGDITVVVDEEDAGEVNRKIKIQENQTIRQEVRLVVARVQKSRKTDRQSEDLRRSLTTRTIEVGQNLMVMMMRRMTMDVVVDVAVDLDVVDSGVEEAVEASGRHSASSFLVSLNVMLCITFNLCILVLRVRLHYT